MARNTQSFTSDRILWIEGRWASNASFVPLLQKKGYSVTTVSSGKEALAVIKNQKHDLVVVNAASMRTSGKRICKSIYECKSNLPIMLISTPERTSISENEYANVVLALPFTIRKLVNRMKPLLPGEWGKSLKAGPIHLDARRKQVRCHGKKTALTPRLISLLKLLMDKKGEVVERDKLFKKVWRTDYTGDTRTLDVHISWLRQAIERNPRKPELIKTIRGVGYRLDV